MHRGRAGRTDRARTHLSACAAPSASSRVSTPSMPDAVTMGAKSAGSAVHCHSGLTEVAALMRAATGSASALMLAHSRAGSTGCAAPVLSARSGWLPGCAACESVRAACARERGARASRALPSSKRGAHDRGAM